MHPSKTIKKRIVISIILAVGTILAISSNIVLKNDIIPLGIMTLTGMGAAKEFI